MFIYFSSRWNRTRPAVLEQNSLKTAEPLKTIECVFYSLQPASAHTNFRNQIVSMAIFVLMKHNPCLLCVNCIAMANENCAIVEHHRKYSGCTAHSLSTGVLCLYEYSKNYICTKLLKSSNSANWFVHIIECKHYKVCLIMKSTIVPMNSTKARVTAFACAGKCTLWLDYNGKYKRKMHLEKTWIECWWWWWYSNLMVCNGHTENYRQ